MGSIGGKLNALEVLSCQSHALDDANASWQGILSAAQSASSKLANGANGTRINSWDAKLA